MLAWLPLLLAVAVFVIIHSHNQSLNEAMVRHDNNDDDDDDDDGGGGGGDDDLKVCHQDQGEAALLHFLPHNLLFKSIS